LNEVNVSISLSEWRSGANPAVQTPAFRARVHDILINKMKLKREPVAVTYCDAPPPEAYAAARVPVCALLHRAEQGQKVYVDARAHDCRVGQYHLGFSPASEAGSLICDGEYLTMAQGFFTPEAARLNKAGSHTLPAGTLRAIAAAPLRDLADDTPLDLLCCITDAQRAMQIAGAASVRAGIMPHGELGPSSCSSLFAAPMLLQNSVFALGEGGGRGFNQLSTSEMFVVLPAHHVHYLIEMFDNFWFKPDEMRRLIMPSHGDGAGAE
jgi:uncharacterized protein (DUF169 family)